MSKSSKSESPRPKSVPQDADQTALACYLGAVVAIGNCVGEVCPAVGGMYRDRLLKLPRRLGFDATPQALQQSREAGERDLVEYADTVGTWIRAGLHRAGLLRDHLQATEETLTAAADLQRLFLDELAEHLDTAAEADDESQLRRSVHRYAGGLRAFSRRMNTEKLAAVDDLSGRREEIEAWLAEAAISSFVDPETGLLNRAAAERRLESEIGKQKPFCAILVESASGESVAQLAEHLAAAVRPYDVIFRWSENRLMTVFDAPGVRRHGKSASDRRLAR